VVVVPPAALAAAWEPPAMAVTHAAKAVGKPVAVK
jgi:hypothetical protein